MRTSLTFVLVFLTAVAAADVVHMADGTRREGRVVSSTPDEVVLDVGLGGMSLQVRIPRADIARIEAKPSSNDILMADYVARLAKARKGTADDWHALGAWCTSQRVLKAQARQAYQQAIAVDPDHAPAHTALGHVKLNDTWMTRDQAIRILAPDLAGGQAKARELAVRKQAEEAKAQAIEAQARLAQLEADLAKLKDDNDSLRKRLAAIPPPLPPERYRPRVIYRPIIIHRPPRKHPRHKGDTKPDKPPRDKGKTPPTKPAEGLADTPPKPSDTEGKTAD